MKKVFLAFFLFFSFVILSNAQPPNDDCTGAQNIGALPAPAACPGTGLGAVLNIPGTIVGATEANPYVYLPGCSGPGGPNMGVPAFDVWYTFTATGYQMQLTINSTFANPNVAMYSGTCGALGGGVGGCAVGAGGTVSLTVDQMVPGNTYYLQVSGNTGETGTFDMLIQNNQSCSDCMIGSALTINPLPVNGAYQPGQVVNYCYTITNYSEENTNWLHGVQITYGSGWSGISNQVPAATVYPNGGTWIWYPAGVVSSFSGINYGPGFYFEDGLGGTAGDNFGDHCGPDFVPTNAYIPCPAGASWTFCWDITVAAGCAPGSDLTVTINTTGDGESGAWNNPGCASDPPTIAPAVGACCPPNMAAVDISCPGMNDGQATATPIGATGPYDYTWNGPGGYINSTAGVVGANTITTLSTSGIYTVSVTDNNNCLTTATVTVNVGAGGIVVPANTGPYCYGATINLSVGAGYVDWDWTGPGGYIQNNTQNPTILSSTPAMSGIYSVTVTNAGGCTSTGTTTVIVNPSVPAIANNTGPYCPGTTIQLSSPDGALDYDWTGPGGYVQNDLQNPTIPASTAAMGGVYTVTVAYVGGCTSTGTTTVIMNQTPTASFIYSPQQILENHPNVTFTNHSIGATSWLWDFGDGSFSNIENPVHTYQDTGTFCITLLVSNNAGCVDTAIGCLFVQPEYSIYIPNTFTVNGDGLNEIWKLAGRGVKSIEVRIFDRWGEELYFFNNLDKGWPGTRQNGVICKQDVYVFRVLVTDGSNDQHTILGNVNLIR